MYTVTVRKAFEAVHYLVAGEEGPERRPHPHRYEMTVEFAGERLDERGYLVDIVAIERVLAAVAGRYGKAVLNRLPEFAGINPSIEHFSRIVCRSVSDAVTAANVHAVTVRMAESADASASYTLRLAGV